MTWGVRRKGQRQNELRNKLANQIRLARTCVWPICSFRHGLRMLWHHIWLAWRLPLLTLTVLAAVFVFVPYEGHSLTQLLPWALGEMSPWR